jgi:hypothetical protein
MLITIPTISIIKNNSFRSILAHISWIQNLYTKNMPARSNGSEIFCQRPDSIMLIVGLFNNHQSVNVE